MSRCHGTFEGLAGNLTECEAETPWTVLRCLLPSIFLPSADSYLLAIQSAPPRRREIVLQSAPLQAVKSPSGSFSLMPGHPVPFSVSS
jgi:hypothetical protein